jgi:hypothetical protein
MKAVKAWPRPGSDFSVMLKNHGVEQASTRGFGAYSGALNGVPVIFTDGMRRADWSAAGEAFMWHVRATVGNKKISVIGHSHAGQVVAYAARFGVCFDQVITMATPVRKDMYSTYEILRARSKTWVHLHSDSADYVQWAGSLFDGEWRTSRAMPHAHTNVQFKGAAHSDFVTVGFWEDHKVWKYLSGAHP